MQAAGLVVMDLHISKACAAPTGVVHQWRQILLNCHGYNRAGGHGAPGSTSQVVLSYHTEYLTRHCLYSSRSEIRIIGTDGSQGDVFLRRLSARCMLIDSTHCLLPGLLRSKGEGAARCLLFGIGFFPFAGTWPSLLVSYLFKQDEPSPAPPSIEDGSPELPEVV